MKKFASLPVFLAFTLGLGALTGLATTDSMGIWYKTLEKPSWTPESYVFPIVWSILYVMIAISGWLYWNKLSGTFKQKLFDRGMRVYAIQLVLNFAWSFLFFTFKSPWLAFIDICALFIFIFGVMFTFRSKSKPAAMLMIPYMLWVLNALGLNLTIALMN
jgi:benzodiazapine receptor